MTAGRRYLFVCGKNRHRSPTAEQIFAAHPGLSVTSAGLASDSDYPLDLETLAWADRVFVMERRHATAIAQRFPASARRAPIVVLGIPDDYPFMDTALIALLRRKMAPHLP